MTWRPFPPDARVRSVAAIILVVAMAFALPSATSVSVPPLAPDPEQVSALLTDQAFPLVPFAPVTAPAEGGSALTAAERADLAARVAAVAGERDARFSIAVQDLRTGTTFSHDANERIHTASAVKLTILALLLLRAEEEGRELTSSERSQAEVMIRYSDNDVTDALYSRIGFTDGFATGIETLGFTNTEPNPRGVWGATETTAADQLRLLRVLYTDESPLSEESRSFARDLMESVAPEQAWGVSAAAEPGDTVGLKNGWTPRDSQGGLWNVNSVGFVAGPDREYLVAVLTDGNPDYFQGIQLVERLVSMVTGTIEGTDTDTDTDPDGDPDVERAAGH